MGVGSFGSYLKDYEECDTSLSTDNGVSWRTNTNSVTGSIVVVVNDDEATYMSHYSMNLGRTW